VRNAIRVRAASPSEPVLSDIVKRRSIRAPVALTGHGRRAISIASAATRVASGANVGEA